MVDKHTSGSIMQIYWNMAKLISLYFIYDCFCTTIADWVVGQKLYAPQSCISLWQKKLVNFDTYIHKPTNIYIHKYVHIYTHVQILKFVWNNKYDHILNYIYIYFNAKCKCFSL